MIIYKTKDEIMKMNKANLIVKGTLGRLAAAAKPGATTFALEEIARRDIREAGADPAFQGYRGYPCCLCVSVNDEIVHGIPSKSRVLQEGDIVGLDFGVVWEGYFGDSAVTVPVGKVTPERKRLMDVTSESLELAVQKMQPGGRLSDISHAVQSYVEKNGFGVVRDFVGHGIGTSLHEDPQVPNFGPPGRGPKLEPGMVLAIEPMVTEKSPEVTVDDDGWTARTRDGGWAAHFEHSIAITERGPWVLGLTAEAP